MLVVSHLLHFKMIIHENVEHTFSRVLDVLRPVDSHVGFHDFSRSLPTSLMVFAGPLHKGGQTDTAGM